jgi:hypothetical protein
LCEPAAASSGVASSRAALSREASVERSRPSVDESTSLPGANPNEAEPPQLTTESAAKPAAKRDRTEFRSMLRLYSKFPAVLRAEERP